ncbi:MAG: DegT/DnrJ/EryC1/StrS family aminotransferase [Nitrospirota bacterium]|jgi:dTDP-4-amino-4,6-dideoxygalactose transaminase
MTKIPYGVRSVTPRAKELIREALEAESPLGGQLVREFEKRFAGLAGTREAVAVSSGTDALALALAVLYDYGAGRGDEVIVPALSFVATGNAVLQAGFTPVFVDIERETLNIDPSKMELAVTDKTRALAPVHIMGKPADMDPIMALADKYDLLVVEDAAQAHGAQYKGRNAGTLGHMAAYSTSAAHVISTVQGGVVATDNEDYAEILRSLRSNGRAVRLKAPADASCDKRFKPREAGERRFAFDRAGFSAGMNDLEAAVGLGSLEAFDEVLEKRRRNLLYLVREFENFQPYISTIREEPHERISPHGLPVIVTEAAKFTRDELVEHLEESGIEAKNLFQSMPTQCAGFSFLGRECGEFPNAEYMGLQGLLLGVHQGLGRGDCDYVLDKVAEFLEENV